jgi:ubiquinol-cytochrome c reductase iron-sulfur subunit
MATLLVQCPDAQGVVAALAQLLAGLGCNILASDQPDFAKNEARAIKPEYLVVVGVCTHLGCAPLDKFTPGDVTVSADWKGGFFCPCHGSKFDLSGRVFKDVPAPTNLPVPPYRYVSDTRILIGAEAENA